MGGVDRAAVLALADAARVGPATAVLPLAGGANNRVYRLDTVTGWSSMAPATAIQSVQRAAHPELYANWIAPAGTWTDALWSYARSCPDAGG